MDIGWNVSFFFTISVDSMLICFYSTTFFSVIFATANSLRLQREIHLLH